MYTWRRQRGFKARRQLVVGIRGMQSRVDLVAMTKEQFWIIMERLDEAGRLDEIIDDDGTVHPTQTAIAYVERAYPKDSPDQKRLRAQAQTLIDHATKYQIELN